MVDTHVDDRHILAAAFAAGSRLVVTAMELFRGTRCVVCAKALSDPKSLELGIDPDCTPSP
jgi:hypothetical protein